MNHLTKFKLYMNQKSTRIDSIRKESTLLKDFIRGLPSSYDSFRLRCEV